MAELREVRVRQIPDHFDGKRWHTAPQEIALVDSKAWVVVRNAKFPNAVPFVISRKDWDKLPAPPCPEHPPYPLYDALAEDDDILDENRPLEQSG